MESAPFPDRTTPQTEHTSVQAVANVAVFAGVGVGLSVLYAISGWGIPCPFRDFTGWLCPFCGGTHLGVDLLRGNLISAWNDNAALLVALFLLGARWMGWIVEWAQHRPRRWLPGKAGEHMVFIAVVLGIAWMIMRNLM